MGHTFGPLIIFSCISMALLIGMVIKPRVGIFKKFLIPASLIGGVLGLIFLQFPLYKIDNKLLENIAYHLYNLAYVSIGLGIGMAGGEKRESSLIKGAWWQTLMMAMSIYGQAIIGGAFVIFAGIAGFKYFSTFGFFLPLGFTGGPGQAVSFGSGWERAGFSNAVTIGITIAAVGFLFAFFVGVPLVNWGIRKGLTFFKFDPDNLSKDLLTGLMQKGQETESIGKATIHPGNVDTYAYHIAMVGVVYFIAYLFTDWLAGIMTSLSPMAGDMTWGFLFFFGLCTALVVKKGMTIIKIDHLIDSDIQRSITSVSIDYLVVTTLMAIQLAIVWTFIVPIVILCVLGGVFTTFIFVYFGRRLDSYNMERSALIYGTVTGTASCGLLLLRIIDPKFKTPVILEFAIVNFLFMLFAMPLMILINAPLGASPISVGMVTLIVGVALLAVLVLMKISKFWGAAKA